MGCLQAAALLAGCGSMGVQAQLYKFDGMPVPEAKSLHTMYAFYVYSHQDAPDRSLGTPFVKFHSLEAHSLSGEKPDTDLADYDSLQLSLLPYNDFWKLINPNKFCSASADVEAKLAKSPGELLIRPQADGVTSFHTHTVKFAQSNPHPKDVEVPVRFTGVYILVFSNCGPFYQATVRGSVVVKNAYGFLPGNEYHKMPFYGWLSFAYVVLAVAWFAMSLRYWRELFHIQNCISGVIFLGLVESFLWFIFYNDWNTSGERGQVLFVFSILSTVVKSIFSYMLVLVASLGWGVTRPYLDQKTIMRIQSISALYIVLDFIRESVLSYRHSHTLSLTFVLLCLLPVSLLNGGIFYWIFTALSGLVETLKERRQAEKLVLFQNLWRLLVFAMSLASLTLLCQIFDLSRSITVRWHYQWLFSDGFSHLLFLLVLMVMMYLWAPTNSSKRYAYAQQADDKEKDKEKKASSAAVWEDDGLDGVEEEESFWATTHDDTKAVAKLGLKSTAQKIGADADAQSPAVE